MKLRSSGALTAVLLGVVVLGLSNLAAGAALPPPAMVVVDARDLMGLREARQAVEALGGRVQGVVPPSILLVRLEPEADEQLIGKAGILTIERGTIPAEGPSRAGALLGRSKPERLAMLAWNQSLRAPSPAVERQPLPPQLLGVDALEPPPGADGNDRVMPGRSPASRPGSTNTRYLCGDCVVTIFLTESDGSLEASSENWTESEETQVTAEIQQGLNWLTDLANTTYNANLTFIYEWHYREPTKYEPISTRAAFPSGNAAAFEILQRKGYFGSLSGGYAFNSAQRLAYGADMAYLIFVADSSADSDGYFADGYIAYGYLGGPWTVENYRNDGWGISRMNQVTAHETGHIFGAGDEYSASGATATQRFGYLSVLNGNAERGGVGGSCIMNHNSLAVCKWTAGQWGLLLPDTTNDRTPDCFQYDAGGAVRRNQLWCTRYAIDDDRVGGTAGNGNGLPEGGETVELILTLQNDALVRMRGVVATLSTSSPYVFITDNTALIGDVDYYGGEMTGADRFAFTVSPTAPGGTARFTVDLATAQGWQFAFDLDVPIAAAPPGLQPPAVPSGLAVTGTGPGWVALRWNQNTEADLAHYNLYRSEQPEFGYALIGQPAANTFTDTAAQNGRTYYYAVSASNTSGMESARSAAVAAVLVDEAPSVTILAPTDGLTVNHDEQLDFSATASDREDGALSDHVVWESSLQGQLGLGASLSLCLEPGTHVILASVTDSAGQTDTATITVTVRAPNSAPSVAIGMPADGAAFTTENLIQFTALASDPEDGDLTSVIVWHSSLEGDFGLGGTIARGLGLGTHVITARATDSVGQTSTDQITISVGQAPLAPPENLAATAQGSAVRLRWVDTNRDETGYRVERALNTGTPTYQVIAWLAANATQCKDGPLPAGAYLYRVRAVRGAEVGPACEPAAIHLSVRLRPSGIKSPQAARRVTWPAAPGGNTKRGTTEKPAGPAAGKQPKTATTLRPAEGQAGLAALWALVADAKSAGEALRRLTDFFEELRRSLRRGTR